MDNFFDWLHVVFKYSCLAVAYMGGFGALICVVAIGAMGVWGVLASIWEECKEIFNENKN